MACNSIHFLDLFTWWTGETLTELNTTQLEYWNPSKRDGFWEVTGKLVAYYSEGSQLNLISMKKSKEPLIFQSRNLNENWILKENQGLFIRNKNNVIRGRVELQSEITGELVESILIKGKCSLTTLKESAQIHKILIRDLLNHWNKTHNTNKEVLPIT